MYICICNALNEKELKRICTRSCAKSGEDVLSAAGVKPDCGQCLDYIEDYILAHKHIDKGASPYKSLDKYAI